MTEPKPTPTIEEVNKAAYYEPRPSKDVGFHADHDPPPETDWADGKVRARKAAEAAAPVEEKKLDTEKGGYKNRAMKSKDA